MIEKTALQYLPQDYLELLKLKGLIRVDPLYFSPLGLQVGDVVQIENRRNNLRATAVLESGLPEDRGQGRIRIGVDLFYRLKPAPVGDIFNIKKLEAQPADLVELGTIHPQLVIKPDQSFADWPMLRQKIRDVLFPSAPEWTIFQDPYITEISYFFDIGANPPRQVECRAVARGDSILFKIADHWFEFNVLRHVPESGAVLLEPKTAIWFKPLPPLPAEQSTMSQLARITKVDIPLVKTWDWFPPSHAAFVPITPDKGFPDRYPIRAGFSVQSGSVDRLNLDKILPRRNLPNTECLKLLNNIEHFTNIRHLSLSGNQLPLFPTFIKNLRHLEILHVAVNDLTSLPEEMEQLTSLKELDASRNKLTTLPDSIGKLRSLVYLDLGVNNLRNIPETLCGLSSLEVLILDGNPIESLPEKLGQLKSLKSLSLIMNSRLHFLPEGLTTLASLKELNITGDSFTAFPEKTRQIIEALRERGCLVTGY